MTPQRRPRDFHGRDGGAGAGRRLPPRETGVAWETNVVQETRVADLAATARLSRSQPSVLPPCRSGRGAAPARRSVKRGFDTATPTPGLPRTRGEAGAGRRLPSSGNRRRMGNKCRAGNKRLAGNARRRSRRYGTAFALAAFCIAPMPQRPQGPARAAGPGLMPQRQPRGFHERAAEPGREGDCPPRETNVAWGTGVARETDVAWETNVAQETRVADLAATARLSRPQPSVLPPCRSGRGAAPGRRSVRRGFDTATPTPGLPWARRRSRGGKATALLGKQASHGEQASRGKQTSHGKQMSRRKRASPISPLRHGFRARSLLYCPHAAATAGPRPGGEA